MNSCIKRLQQDLKPDEIIMLKLPEDYELTVRKTDKISCTGSLLVINRNGKKTVVNTNKIIFCYTREGRL